MSEFPERLRKLRERKRLKRYVLSERCGLNSDAIRRYELGTAKPTLDALKSIADELIHGSGVRGVSITYSRFASSKWPKRIKTSPFARGVVPEPILRKRLRHIWICVQ